LYRSSVKVLGKKNNIVFHKKVYNKVMRFRGLLEEDNSDRQCGKIKAGFG